MKIHWVNPSFLDYRVPLYQAINELLGGHFHITYSKNRVPERIVHKVEAALGENAHGLSQERIIQLGRQGNFANQGIHIPVQKGLYKAVNTIDADVMITEGFFQWAPVAAWVARRKNIPLWVAYERTKHTERQCPYWRTTYRKVFDTFVHGYLVNGRLTKEYLQDNIAVTNKPLVEGCMSADSEGLAKMVQQLDAGQIQKIKEKLQISTGKVFLFIGQLIDRKGIVPLLEAWCKYSSIHPEDHLLVIGTGDLEQTIQEKFGQLASLKLLGAVNYDEIYTYYAASDVFVMPTLEDNWSLVVPEAMACGLPVATTLYNGCYPELIKEGQNGFVFDSLNQDSIVQTLEAFKDVDLQAFGQQSMLIESHYSTKVVAQRIVDAITSNVSRKR